MEAVEVHILESGLLSLSLCFFPPNICFDVLVDVDLDNNRLYFEHVVKQCLLFASPLCSI